MHVLILGASGRTGAHLVEQALAGGFIVSAFVRDPNKIWVRNERLHVVRGDVRNAEDVDRAMVGVDAVVSALGAARSDPADTLTVGMENVVAAMRAHGVRRLVALTSADIPSTRDLPQPTPFGGRSPFSALRSAIAGDALRDAEGMVQALRSSDLEWTVVRVPRLTDGPRSGAYRVGYLRLNRHSAVSRADAAEFILQQLTDDAYLFQMPMVSE